MVYAALGAAAVGFALGLTAAEVAAGIAGYVPVGRRARLYRAGKLTVIDDCYNANPTSNRAAIDSMLALPGRKLCVLGDMREMGERSPQLHWELGRYAMERGVARIFTQGQESVEISRGAGEEIASHFADKASLLAALQGELRGGDVVLVKASHGAHFEEIVEALIREKD